MDLLGTPFVHQLMSLAANSSVSLASSAARLMCRRRAGLRLPAWRSFSMLLAVSRRQPSAATYSFCSVALLQWPHGCPAVARVLKVGRVLQAIGSNISLKRTRILRAAYLSR